MATPLYELISPIRIGFGWAPAADELAEAARSEALGRALARWASAHGDSVAEVLRYHRLRNELLEIDAAARRLERDRSSARGKLFSDGDLEEARVAGPADTRAALRGKWVSRLGGTEGRTRFRCDWGGLWDLVAGTTLDLRDPSATAAAWESPGSRAGQGDLFAGLRDWLNREF